MGATVQAVAFRDYASLSPTQFSPPVIDAFISSGSPDVFINGKPAARAAGKIAAAVPEAGSEPTYLDIAELLLSPRPTVAAPGGGRYNLVLPIVDHRTNTRPCRGSSTLPGSSKVFINGQPAVRSGQRAPEATVGKGGRFRPTSSSAAHRWWCVRFAAARRRV